MRKGYGIGKGQGYKNLMPMDSHIHSLSAKGVKTKLSDVTITTDKKGRMVKIETFLNAKAVAKKLMVKKIKDYVKDLKKRYGDDDDGNFVVDANSDPEGDLKKKNFIELRTDGFVYEQLFDPTLNETPYLVRDAIEEFGMDKKKIKIPSAWEEQEKFIKFLEKNGWDFEPYGYGVITIYKEEK